MPEIRVLTPIVARLGENPVWDVETERLYWIDVYSDTIFRSTADGRELTVWRSGRINALALRAREGAIVVSGRQIMLYDFESGDTDLVFESDTALNDCKVDRQGRLVTGGLHPALTDPSRLEGLEDDDRRAALYRVDPDLRVHVFGDGVGVSNGPTFSPDGRTVYWSDSGSRRIYAWDYDTATGLASGRRVQSDFAADTEPGTVGVPDGATVDAEGYRWVASFFGNEVRRYAPNGKLDRRLALPIHSPTSVAFGGPDLDVLFVTSLSMDEFPGNPHRKGPLDGMVLAVHGLGVSGVPEVRFAG